MPRFKVAGLLALLLLGGVAQAQVDKALQTVEKTNQADAASQNKIDQLSVQTREMLEAYRQAIRKTQQLQVYNRELERIVAEQQSRRDALASRIESVGGLREDIEPLMLRMIDSLQRFIEADLPFKQQERLDKVQALRQTMADPETGVAEKFRKVLAAYQSEAEYGRTIGSYRGEISFSGQDRLVEFLRVGRVSLFYITPDESAVGYWNKQAEQWQALPSGYRTSIRNGIKVAKDLAAPQLLEIAVPAPERAEEAAQTQSSGEQS